MVDVGSRGLTEGANDVQRLVIDGDAYATVFVGMPTMGLEWDDVEFWMGPVARY